MINLFNCCNKLIQTTQSKEFKYRPESRDLVYYFWNECDSCYYGHCLAYCIFCGSKLPESLFYVRFDIMDEELGDGWNLLSDDQIPPEFQTDEWWVKRGL